MTQDNRGKKTPGVDGIAALTPAERLALAEHLPLDGDAAPVRRVYIPKPGTDEQRPLGIPTIADRAKQGVVKHALEPAWEAQVRTQQLWLSPGTEHLGCDRSDLCPDQPETEMGAGCGHRQMLRSHRPRGLVTQARRPANVSRQLKAWLKAGVWDKGDWTPTDSGDPARGVASPLLANVALHGLEEMIQRAFPGRGAPAVIRYADDLRGHTSRTRESDRARSGVDGGTTARDGIGMKPSKTRITHTLHGEAGGAGFDFLGFNIRQYPTKAKRGDKTIITPSRRASGAAQATDREKCSATSDGSAGTAD